MNFNLQKWYDNMQKSEVLFAYRGEMSAELITSVLEQVEHKLDEINEESKVRKKLYNVLVEALQNLYHHIDEPPLAEKEQYGKNFAIFVVYKDNGIYKISTGNFVRPEKMQMLKDRIDQINFLTKDELKALYKLILNNEEFSEKGGGGLGMIDIARKTGNRLEYNFHTYSNDKKFFCLDVTV